MVKFKNVPTLSGNVSFSAKQHTVFGRAYRVIEINNNKPQWSRRSTRRSSRTSES